jgi:acetyl esterase/lipase
MSFEYKVLERCIRKIDFKKMYDTPDDQLQGYLNRKFRAYDVPDFFYKRFNTKKTEFKMRPLFRIRPKGKTSENVILFIHGGGGMICPTALHYRFAAKLVRKTGAVMYFPFYPLGPEASIDESMAWLDKLYNDILKHHSPENITIIGDSAGASLAISLCRRNEIRPKGIILISPAVGIDRNDGKMKEMEKDDVILSLKTIELTKKYWIKDADLENADFNTLSVDYSGFPPIQLYYGTAELFYPYIDALIERIRSGGVRVKAFEGEGLCHDWVLLGMIPEARKAFERICNFISE